MAPQRMIQSRRASVENPLAELRAEIAALEKERADLDIAERVFDRLSANVESTKTEKLANDAAPRWATTGDELPTGDEMRAHGIIPPQAHLKGELEDIIRTIILETGRPMPRSQIVQALLRRSTDLES